MTKINNGEWRLLEELIEKKNEQESRINDTNIAQPTLFAIQVALTVSLISWNIYSSSIISQSAGDQAAAFVAGRLTLEETVRIEHLACIAVVNSPRSATISGDEKTIDEIQQILTISYPNLFKARLRIENAFHSYQMNRFDIEKEMLSSLKDIRGFPIQGQKQIFNPICAKAKLYSSVIGEQMNDDIPVDAAIIKDEAANVFLEISPHPVLAKSIRECYELTNQQQSSPPLILPTLKRKEDEQITLLTSLAQLTTSSPHVWQQYFHTRQILPLKNHEEYFDDFPLYKFHLSSCWYVSKDSSIQRLANRISTHSLLGICQLNEQTSATWKSLININVPQHAFLKDHKIQDAILFPAVGYLDLATAACQQLLSSKEDDQQQPKIIFENWYIVFRNQDNLNKYSLNEFTLHAQGKIEIDSKQQKSLTIPDRWTIQDIRSAYEHLSTRAYQYGSSFQKIKTLHGTSTTVISQLSNDNNNCSSYYLLYPYLVLLPGIETTFLPVRILKFIYSSKTKAKMNRSTNVEVRGIYHDNICGIDQEEIYNLDLWTFTMDNKTEEPIFTFEGAVIQQVQGVQSVTWHSTQLRLIQLIQRFPRLKPFLITLNKYGLHLKDIFSGEKNGLDIFVGDDEIGQSFQQIKTLISATKTQQIFHSIWQHLQLQYERQTKDDNSFEKYRLRIFLLTDSDCSDVLPILDLFLNLSQQTGLLIDLHYADSDPTQLANAQQTFNTHINNQTKNLSIIYDETIDLYDSKILEKIPIESFDIIFSANQLQGNQDLTNCLIDLRRLLVPNGLLLLLELVHVPLCFDLILCFFDQWWSSSDDNNRALNNIQQWTTLLEQIEGFNIIESTLNENENTICFGISVLLTTYKQVSIIFAWQLDQTLLDENNDELAFKQNEELICGTFSRILQTIKKLSSYFYPLVYVLTDHAQFNVDSNLNIIASPFIGLTRTLITEYERNRLKLIDLQISLNNNNNQSTFIHTLVEYMIRLKIFN
ncbi:unnamed protein product [Adineta steineri]|uniref:PKS/mFAS DH domain-containing protein n=1 Tax=Adineta steineri TaxID=433720 RepID=A0A819P0T9_9BILA|nr:unnamed protein product [Adineta steineri]